MIKELKNILSWIITLSVILSIAILIIYPIYLAFISFHFSPYHPSSITPVINEQQKAMNRISPEKGLTFKLSQKYGSSYTESIIKAMHLINSGTQKQVQITGPLDNDILTLLEMKGFVVTHAYSKDTSFPVPTGFGYGVTTYGYTTGHIAIIDNSTTEYIIEKNKKSTT